MRVKRKYNVIINVVGTLNDNHREEQLIVQKCNSVIVITFGKSQMKTDSDYCEFRSFKKVNNLYLREIGLKNFRKQTKRKTRFFFYGSYTTYNDNNYCC